jgi:hypothetical protein
MQRIVIGFGCLVIALLALFPLVRVRGTSTTERGFLFAESLLVGPSRSLEVETGRLLAEVLLVAALCGLVLCFTDHKEGKPPASAPPVGTPPGGAAPP